MEIIDCVLGLCKQDNQMQLTIHFVVASL